MKRNDKHYNKIVARVDNEYYVLQYTFEHDDGFKGAVGSVFYPITKNCYDWDNDIENLKERMIYRYLSIKRDKYGNFSEDDIDENDFTDWCENLEDEDIYDLSYFDIGMEVAKLYESESGEMTVFSECIGGGRCFDPDTSYTEIYEPELMEIINKLEGKVKC